MPKIALDPVESAFFRALEQLVHKTCWGVAAGAGTGANVCLHFGKKLKRKTTINNSFLQPELRQWEGELMLFVECDWEIRQSTKLLCSSRDNNAAERAMLTCLNHLRGAAVLSVSPSLPLGSLSLELSKQFAFRLEARRQHHGGDNFTVSTAADDYVVGPDLQIRIERRVNAIASQHRVA